MIKKISFIGSGNVAFHLSHVLKDCGFKIHQVYSRNIKNAMGLALTLDADFTDDIEKINNEADMYIIAVKDDAVKEIVSKINFKNAIVVHTSGSLDINILKDSAQNYGVFYPLQSFKKDKKIDIKTVPICLEANNTDTSLKLKEIAEKLSENVHFVSSENRIKLHIAAIFLNNFSNFMLTVSRDILKENNLPNDLLEPLLKETKEKLSLKNPELYQTGPAKRGDTDLVEKHLELLQQNEQQKTLYKLISSEIMKYYKCL